MKMTSINVEGLPEPVIEALAQLVEALREQFQAAKEIRPHVDLLVFPGKVIGKLTREEIYEDVGAVEPIPGPNSDPLTPDGDDDVGQ